MHLQSRPLHICAKGMRSSSSLCTWPFFLIPLRAGAGLDRFSMLTLLLTTAVRAVKRIGFELSPRTVRHYLSTCMQSMYIGHVRKTTYLLSPSATL